MRHAISLPLLLKWTTAATLLCLSPAAAAAEPQQPECLTKLKQQLAAPEADLVTLASELEWCYRETGASMALLYQANAHLALKQHVRALIAYERFIREQTALSKQDQDERGLTIARTRRAQLLAREEGNLVEVRLTFVPPVDETTEKVELAVRRGDETAIDTTSIEFDLAELSFPERPSCTDDAAGRREPEGGASPCPPALFLERGLWKVRVQRPGFDTARERVFVPASGLVNLQIEMVPVGTSSAPPPARDVRTRTSQTSFPRRPWLVMTGIGSGVLVLGGVGTFAVGQWKYNQLIKEANKIDMACAEGDPLTICHNFMSESLNLRMPGAAVFGGGLGLLAGGMTALVPRERSRKIAWYAELGAGGALAAVGGALWGFGLLRFDKENRMSDLPWSQEYLRPVDHASALAISGAALVGLGAGLALTAGVGLIVERAQHGRSHRAAGPPRLEARFGGLQLRF